MVNAKKLCSVRTLALLICAVLIGPSGNPAYAAPTAAELQEKTSELQEEVDGLSSELSDLTSRLEKTADKVEKKAAELDQAKLDLAAARLNEENQYNAMKDRIQFMYEGGNLSLFEILMTSESMSDFLNKAEYVTMISDYDRDMLNEFRSARENVEEKEALLEKEQKELTDLKAELDSQQKEIKEKLSSASAELKDYSEELKKAEAAEAAIKAALSSGSQVSGNGGGSYFENPMDADTDTIALLAGILECEAGISYEGMIAAGTVIMNRVESSKYPNTIEDVVYQSGQFEPVSTGKLSRVLARGPEASAYKAAKAVLGGERHSKVRSCLYFNATFTGKPGIVVGDNVFW